MWDGIIHHPRGRISLRNLLLVASGLLAAVFMSTLVGNTALAADAYRTVNGFSYQGKDFTNAITIDPKPKDQRNPYSQPLFAYEYYDSATNKAEYISFTDQNTIPTVTTGIYLAFDVISPGNYKQTAGPTTITISNNPPPGQTTPPATQVTATPSQQNAGQNTCNVPAIGWIVCPVTSQLAAMIDGIYDVLMQFLDVKPMLQGGPVYDVWDAVKNIANICFVIAFLIIIFSQVTSLGISNYGLKKLLPRLIIAAILVNVSYWVCALGVDLSNFLGHSVYEFLMAFAKSMNAFKVELSWGSIADGILGATAGAGIVAGGLLFSVSTAGSHMAALFTLLGMLVSVTVAVVTALFILMARQALIIVFTIISPLAFVALLLPKTEKWFDRWKDTFVAMLIMFPLFSLVFGGAVLAGAAIIAGANNNIFLILLGKGTQLMPLAITPLIVKFSTGVLGTIANFTNNKNKGLIDRAKNWTSGKAEFHRKKSLANNSTFGRYNPFRRTAQFFDNRERAQKVEQEGFEKSSSARAKSTRYYRNAYNYARSAGLDDEAIDNKLKGDFDNRRRTHAGTAAREITRRQTEVYAKKQSEMLEKMHSEVAAEGAQNTTIQRLSQQLKNVELRNALLKSADNIKLDTEDIAFTGIAKKVAERAQQDNVATILETQSRTVDGMRAREYAGGIQGLQGEHSALAYAVALQRKQYGESVSEMNELMKHYAPDSGDLQKMITGKAAFAEGVRKDKNGNIVSTFKFERGDNFAMEAALENNISIGTVPMVEDIIVQSGSQLAEYRTTIANALAKSGMGAKSIYLGGRLINEVAQGNITNHDDLIKYIQAQITDGKFSAAQLATIDAPAIHSFLEAAQTKLADPAITDSERSSISDLAKKAYDALTDPQIKANVKRNAKFELLNIKNLDATLPPLNPDDL